MTVDVTGTWQGSTSFGWIELDLEQQGTRIKGSMRSASGGRFTGGDLTSGPIDGTVAGDVFTFKQTNGRVAGETTVSGDEMRGQVRLYGPEPVTLRRVNSSSPPRSQQP